MKRTIALLAVLLALAAFAQPAGAQIPDDQRPPLVTDYANYPGTPQAFLTPGCDFSGVLGSTFTVAFAAGGSAGPVGDLAALPVLAQDDLVTWSWTGVAPECVGSAVSMVVKVALGPSFDPNVDQLTGPNGGYAVEFVAVGPGSMSFPMPDLARFGLGCDYQLDAIVGIPLQDVGPSGSFFTEELRVATGKQTADHRTTVISAKNGVYPSCVVPPTTTVAPTTTANETTTTLTVTLPPTTTVAPTVVTQNVTPPVQNVRMTPPAAVVTPAPLPATGADTWAWALIGLGAIVAGVTLLGWLRLRRHP